MGPAASVKIMLRVPQGWVVGGMIHSTSSAAIRSYSASTSSTRKSRMTSDLRGAGPSRYSVKRRLENPTDI
jgi:hypothetical protein